jgi:hypothetical protein
MKQRLALAFIASILSRTPATAQLAPPPATQYSIPIVGTAAAPSLDCLFAVLRSEANG